MTKANLVIALFVVAALRLLGAWWIALSPDHEVGIVDSKNFNAWLAAGGFFGFVGFVVERLR